MATASMTATLRKVFDGVRDSAGHADGELLARYRTVRDQDAFGSLVRRHGPMVLGVCQRVLRDTHAADDAFQATFLVLAKKAAAVRPPDRLAPWLYGVAYRTALKARGRTFRRQQVEGAYATEASRSTTATPDAGDLLPVIDEQLNALPEKYRDPLVLCGVQGLNKSEAAERLGIPEGTVSSRLARAREMLRDRLTRRGVVVPAAAFATLFTADTMQAAVTPALATSTVGVALGSSVAPATVLTLSHEVIRSMTLLKLKFLGTLALSATLVGGGFGVLAIQADEKKSQPAQGDVKKPAKPDGDKPKPAPEGDKPAKPDGEKPLKPAAKGGGRVAAVDAKGNTITIAVKGEGGLTEKVVKLAAGAKVFIDGKEAKLADVPKGSFAAFAATGTKDGVPPEINEVRVTGGGAGGTIKKIDASSITLDSEKNPQTFKLTADTKVTVSGKDAKATDLKVGEKVSITLSADGASALVVAGGIKGDGEKPAKPNKFTGKVTTVDAAARTINLAGKVEGNDIVIKLTPDAKITVDGKEAKIGGISKGGLATFTISSAKDGQQREANEVVVAGLTFGGSVKQVDATSVTVGTEKNDRVLKLAADGKVVVSGKDAKLADLKVGDRVLVTLTSDEAAALVIVAGVKKPDGDKPKPEKGSPEGDE